MEAAPAVGDLYRQEFSFAVAEDVAEVSSLAESVSVPAGSFSRCVETMDYTPLTPDAVELKFYAPGTGLVLEIDPDTGERLELVRVSAGP